MYLIQVKLWKWIYYVFEHIKFQSQEISAIMPNTFFGRKRKDGGDLNIVAIWQREEDRERRIREEEAREIAEAEQIHQENIKRIREQAKKNLDTPPDPPSVTGSPADSTSKRLDHATFVTDLLQKYDVKKYIRTV